MDDFDVVYKIYLNARSMLLARGYNLDEKPSLETFRYMYDNNNFNIDDKDNKIKVIFGDLNKTVTKKDLDQYIKYLKTYVDPKNKNSDIENKFDKLIVISKDKISSSVEKDLLTNTYKNIEVFTFANLSINIIQHSAQPIFIPLTAEDSKIFLNEIETKKTELPRIGKNDPVSKYFGLKPGQVLKCIRQSPSDGQSIYYRLCQ